MPPPQQPLLFSSQGASLRRRGRERWELTGNSLAASSLIRVDIDITPSLGTRRNKLIKRRNHPDSTSLLIISIKDGGTIRHGVVGHILYYTDMSKKLKDRLRDPAL